jgi:hypothetical protein
MSGMSVTRFSLLRIPEFQTAYRNACRDVQSQATARLQQAAGAAAMTMLKLMVDVNVPAAVVVAHRLASEFRSDFTRWNLPAEPEDSNPR